MTVKCKRRDKKRYATVAGEEGVNYRDIADTLTIMGHPMNHSSVRNHVIRIMRKFAVALSQEWDLDLDESKLNDVAKSSMFQNGVADALHSLECMRRSMTN